MKIRVPCGFGCAIGLVTIHLGIILLYGIVYPFIKKKKNPLNDWTEPKEWNDLSIYDEEDDWDLSKIHKEKDKYETEAVEDSNKQ